MVGLIGKKLGHTRIYDAEGKIVPVTVVLAGPNRVVQCKTVEKDGYSAVQLGFDDQKESRVNKALNGHFKKHNAAPVKKLREFRDFSLEVKQGDVLNVDVFAQGDYVDCIGITKGRGFEGVVKRYDFRGGPATHGGNISGRIIWVIPFVNRPVNVNIIRIESLCRRSQCQFEQIVVWVSWFAIDAFHALENAAGEDRGFMKLAQSFN